MTVIVLGAVFGAGVLLVVTGLHGTRPDLASVLARLDQPASRAPEPASPALSVLERLVGAPVSGTTFGARLVAHVDADLNATGQTAVGFLTAIVVHTAVTLTVASALLTMVAANDLGLDPTITTVLLVATTITAGLVPFLRLRGEAARRRQACRHALSSYLDLVAIRLAGGAGIDTALTNSAHAGNGSAFQHIDTTLAAARLAGRAPWTGFAQLGEQLGVPEFGELAASMALAGDEGARVRVSLAAKATAMRTRALAETERHAHAANERMSLPLVILMAGFVIFLGYPAVMNVVQGI